MCETARVIGYENYVVDRCGNVFNEKTGRKMKQQKTNDGYSSVSLCMDGRKKTFLVHRLVAAAFLPNTENLPEVNHKDENKGNNTVENLEWCTHDYNCRYGENAPVKQWVYLGLAGSAAQKKKVYQMDGNKVLAIYPSTADAEKETGVKRSNIQKCCSPKSRNKTAGGFRWLYESEVNRYEVV